jgi:hypothetical protein
MTAALKASRRRYIRFKPDPESVAFVTLEGTGKKDPGKIHLACLIVDEAPRGGCCLVSFHHDRLHLNSEYLVKVGPLHPLRAKLVWLQSCGDDMVKLGFQFVE